MTGIILNIINGFLKFFNMLIKIVIFLAEKVLFTLYRGVGELIESAYKVTHRLVAQRVPR